MDWMEVFKFEIVEDKYKIYFYGDKPLSVFISTKLIGLNSIHHTIHYTFKAKGTWFIPNLDYRGCSFISFKNANDDSYLFDKIIDKKLSKTSKGQNVICIGLNKTGTSSFTTALENIGYKKFSENQQFQFLSPDVYHGDYGKLFSVLDNPQFNLFNDIPFSLPKVYEKIYENRPNDIFILTVRESSDKWVKSVINFYEGIFLKNSFIETTFTNSDKRLLIDYLTPMFDSWKLKNNSELEVQLKETYEKHYQECLKFFSNNPNFFIVEIEKKGELKKFLNWLNVDSDKLDFPWVNKGPI